MFKHETWFIRHMCELKRRFLQRDDKSVKLGYMAFQQFYQRSMRKPAPSYDKFSASNLYTGFVRFGRYVIDLQVVKPLSFLDFLLSVETPIDRWTKPILYETYIRELNKNEAPLDALERNFLLMQQWANNTGDRWQDFFRRVEPPLAALWIGSGRISPWVLFVASSAHDLLSRFSPEQNFILDAAIDPVFWRLKIKHHQADVDIIRAMLTEHGI